MRSLDLPFWALKSAAAGLPSGCSRVTASWALAVEIVPIAHAKTANRVMMRRVIPDTAPLDWTSSGEVNLTNRGHVRGLTPKNAV